MEALAQSADPTFAEVLCDGRLIAEGRVTDDGGNGLLFTQWKGHPPLPLHRSLHIAIRGIAETPIARVVVVAPYTYRLALGE